jgi:hypothetical protein
MKLRIELTDWDEFKDEILKPLLLIILLHLHCIILLSILGYPICGILQVLIHIWVVYLQPADK